MKKNVTYPAEMRLKAKTEGLQLITIDAMGMTLQAPATKEHAKQCLDLAVAIFTDKKKPKAAKRKPASKAVSKAK